MLDEDRVEFGGGEAVVVASHVDRGRREIDRQPTTGSAASHADRGRAPDRQLTSGGAASHVDRGRREIDRQPTTGGAASHADHGWQEIDRQLTTGGAASHVDGGRAPDRQLTTGGAASHGERGRAADRQLTSGGAASHVDGGWREIDRQLRRIAKRRAVLDAEEAPVLLAAMRAEVHVHLGYGTFAEYLERVCGYTPHTARERMRVAEALETMPVMRGALAAGDVSYSAVREMTRKIDADTEAPWLDALQGCTVREIEDALRGHKLGDLPTDRPDPAIEPRRVRLELPPDVYALFLEARRAAEHEAGESMTDAEFMALACRRMLDGDRPTTGNQPAHTIAITTCRDCKRGWHETGSQSIELPPAAIEQARCDAFELGDVDGDTPSPMTRTIPAPIRRAVLARDHHRCVIPGCRSSQYIDVHHLTPFAAGGPHELPNLITLCTRHHSAAHVGRIVITGTPTALTVTHADGRPYGAAPPCTPPASVARTPAPSPTPNLAPTRWLAPERPAAPHLRAPVVADARSALINLGMRPAEATAAVSVAAFHMDREPTLDALIRAALRASSRPHG